MSAAVPSLPLFMISQGRGVPEVLTVSA